MLAYNSLANKVAIRLLYLLLTMVFVSYIPMIYLTSLYGRFSMGIMGVMAIIVLFTIPRSHFFKNYFFRILTFAIFFLTIEFVVFYVGHLHFEIDDVRQIVIAFLCMIVGYSVNMTEKQMIRLCLFYIVGAVLLGGYAIVSYTGGFSFGNDRNLITGKNQIGGMVAVAGALTLYLYFILQERKFVFLMFAILAFAISAVLRDRSAFVAFAFFAIVMSFKIFPAHKVIIVTLLILLLYLVFRQVIDSFFTNVLIGRGSFDIENLSTGRFERNRQGIQYLFDNFWEGELLHYSYIPLIHNYLLLRLVRYGVWSVLFVAVYAIFLIKMIKEYFRERQLHLDSIGYFILIIPFFVSLLEPSFPYGPGTVQIMVYVLFGQTLQKKQYRLRR